MILAIIILLVFIFAKVFIFAMSLVANTDFRKIGSSEISMDIHLNNLRQYRDKVMTYLAKKLGITFSAANEHFGRIFINWIFQANMRNSLDRYFIPTDNIINKDDITYFCESRKIRTPANLRFIRDSNSKVTRYKISKSPKLLRMVDYLEFDQGKLRMTQIQYRRLYTLYINSLESSRFDENSFNIHAYYLLNIYNTLGGLSNNASIPLGWPKIDGANFIELFGSPLNTQYQYCSPFKEQIEGKFGSLGSFFNFDLHQHTHYIANPPFDEHLMEQMALRFLDFFDEAKVRKSKLVIIIILPIWDSISQRTIGIPDYGKVFVAYDLLTTSPYFKSSLPAHRDDRQFYDYYGDKYRPIANSHLIVMANDDAPTAAALHQQWLTLQKIT